MKHNKSIFGIYRTKPEIKTAIKALKGQGFKGSDISLLFSEHAGAKDYSYRHITQIKKGAIIGAINGFFVLGLIGLIVGIGYFPMTPEVLGTPDALAQNQTMKPIMLTAFAALIGGLVGAGMGALVGIGTPQPAGKRYGKYLKAGGILLAVHIDNADQIKNAKEVLETTEAQDITILNEVDGMTTAAIEENTPGT